MSAGEVQGGFTPRPGAMRFKDEHGFWVCSNPRDPMYSTVTMRATEYWRAEQGWVNIADEDAGADS